MKSHEFASLLCSRLCHDLLSPIGALNNGIELLADEQDPEMRARCLDLLGESARASANKLKFFRSLSVLPAASARKSTPARREPLSMACSARTAASRSAGWWTSRR
jgi:hypothetical protein